MLGELLYEVGFCSSPSAISIRRKKSIAILQEESKEEQDTDLILDLMRGIRENIKLVNDLMIGTPVIAKIKREKSKA